MGYTVQSVQSKKDWKAFLRLPQAIYANDPNWIAPLFSEVKKALDTQKNPYFKNANAKLLLCLKQEEIVARVAIIINRDYWKRWGRKAAFFGFFEAINDPTAVEMLFRKAVRYAQQQGATSLIGPFNPNHYSELGLLIENFDDPPVFFETYNPPYYQELLEGFGFHLKDRLHTRRNQDVATYVNKKHPNGFLGKDHRSMRIRPFRLRKMKKELEGIRQINNDAFYDNLHFLPLSPEEYQYAAQYLFFVTKPKLVLLIEKNDVPIGVLQCMLNINPLLKPLGGKVRPWNFLRLLFQRNKVKEIVLYAAGIKKGYQNSYAIKLLLEALLKLSSQYPVMSTSWISEGNQKSIKVSETIGLQPYKWFGIFEKVITE
jgi:hypothetical protein